MELTRTTAKEGRSSATAKEPYLRLDSTGVFENINSPAHYLNPRSLRPHAHPTNCEQKAQPNWVKFE